MASSKKTPAKKPAAPAKTAKPAAKPAAKAPDKPAPKAAATAKPATAKAEGAKARGAMTAADLKRLILDRKAGAGTRSISFSLDEVREIAKKNEKTGEPADRLAKGDKPGKGGKAPDHAAKTDKPHKPHHVKPASLADILGFNPNKGSRKPALLPESEVPEKFRRYYKLLVEMRDHLLVKLGEHTEETLMKSAKDDSGDLSGYGQHMADAGTDTFDRDFALSLVSSEQEALAEIEAAIKRIHDGSYGICEVTQKPIAKERLLAVPFTRYSAEARKQVERHSHRAQQRGGLFGDASEEEGGAKAADEDAGGGDD
jgi:RNA polymerase-binding transcription factor DksA